MANRSGKMFSYSILFCLFLLAFLYVRFPYEIFLPRIIGWLEPKLSPARTLQIEAEHLSPYWLTGVTLENFKLTDRGAKVFEADRLSVRLRILPLLVRKVSLAFKAAAYGGQISGSYTQKKLDVAGKLDLKNVRIEKIAYLQDSAHFPLQGVLKGNAKYAFNRKTPNQGRVEGAFYIEKGKLGPGTILGPSNPYRFELTSPIRLDDKNGALPIKITMDKGQLRPSIKFNNDDSRADVSGTLTLGPSAFMTNLNLQVSFWLSDKVRESNSIPAFLFESGVMPQARGSDGSYSFKVIGPAINPRWEPFRL